MSGLIFNLLFCQTVVQIWEKTSRIFVHIMHYSNSKTVKSCSLFAGPCLPNKYWMSKASISYQEAEEKYNVQYDMHDHITSWWGLQLIINTEAEVNGFFLMNRSHNKA